MQLTVSEYVVTLRPIATKPFAMTNAAAEFKRTAPRPPSAKKWLAIIFINSFVMSLLTSCSSTSTKQPSTGVHANDYVVLSTLAFIAKTGQTATCDETSLSNILDVEIRPFKSSEARRKIYEYEGEVFSRRDPRLQGSYYRTLQNNTRSCQLDISYSGRKICDTKEKNFDSVIGKKREAYNPIPGRTISNVFYSFDFPENSSSQINLG